MASAIQLEQDEREQLGKDFDSLIQMHLRDRQLAMQRRQVARNLYHDLKIRDPRYKGASNIHLPVIEEKVEGFVPKLVNAFFGADPIVHTQRVAEEFSEKETDNVERFLNWAVENDIPNFYDTIESWFRNMLLDGVSTLKVYWEKESRNTVEVTGQKSLFFAGEVDGTGEPLEAPRPKFVLEVLATHFPGLYNAEPVDDGDLEAPVTEQIGKVFSVSFVESRRDYQGIQVQIGESEYVDEVQLHVYRPIIVCNNPRVEVIEYEDLILPYRTWDIQSAPHVVHRYWLTYAEFKRKAEQEGWELEESDWAHILNATKTSDRHERDPYDRQLARQRDAAVGEFPEPGPGKGRTEDDTAPYLDGKLMMYEIYAREDLNDDGTYEEVVYQMPAVLSKVVKAYYLEELFPHGRRPFVDAHYVRVSDRWYSRSLGEQLYHINLEVDSIVNTINEAQELINNPFFFYVPYANTVDPGVLENIEPGQGIPVADANAVFFPKFPQEPLANLSAVDSMLLFADRLTMAPQAVGSSQVRNAPRTARGTLALLSEAGVKTDLIITGLQKRGWRELFQQIHGLYAAFGDDTKWFHVTNEAYPRKITPQELRGRWEYTFKGNSVNTNREVKRSIAQLRYTTLISNPLFAMDMNAMKALTMDFLRHFSEGTDIDKLEPKLPGAGGSHPPMDQKTELEIMVQGHPVEVLPTDDHVAHLQTIEQFQNSPRFEEIPQWAVGLIASHKNQHLQFLQQLATQQGGPIQPGAGMANNVPTGMNNAQTDMNALEGGVQ